MADTPSPKQPKPNPAHLPGSAPRLSSNLLSACVPSPLRGSLLILIFILTPPAPSPRNMGVPPMPSKLQQSQAENKLNPTTLPPPNSQSTPAPLRAFATSWFHRFSHGIPPGPAAQNQPKLNSTTLPPFCASAVNPPLLFRALRASVVKKSSPIRRPALSPSKGGGSGEKTGRFYVEKGVDKGRKWGGFGEHLGALFYRSIRPKPLSILNPLQKQNPKHVLRTTKPTPHPANASALVFLMMQSYTYTTNAPTLDAGQ